MKMLEDIPLAPLTTFRMGPIARCVLEIERLEDLPEAFTFIRESGLPYVVLGGGSNTIFTEAGRYEGVVLKVALHGFEISEDDAEATVRIGAGEEWDQVVARAVDSGLSGIEALSAIPGSAGATPVQNVGAYGVEVADVLESVSVYDIPTGSQLELSKDACGFSYRDSVFKHDPRYLITSITLRLGKDLPKVPEYPGVQQYLEAAGIAEPTLQDIRTAITEIRWKKLPDPKDIASCGSFFKNPFVDEDTVGRLRQEFEKPVVFAAGEGWYKVGAGWLIDMLGLKGKSFGSLSLYKDNALVIVNEGGATYAELDDLVRHIQDQVHERFGIRLEPEPVFV